MADNLQNYHWIGINHHGKKVSGNLHAVDSKAAQLELKKLGVEVITLQSKQGINLQKFAFLSRKGKVKSRDIIMFTRYLSTMLAAGLPIIQSLDIVAQEQENETMKSMLIKIKNNISEGKTLAESFGMYPKYFGDLYCNLIKTGEKSGTLDKTLIRLCVYLERSESLRRKLKKALVYPIAIMTVAMVVSLILLIFVVPKFQAMFASFGAQLPFFTLMIVKLSNFVRGYWWLMLALMIMSYYVFKYYYRASNRLRERIDKWSLNMYIIGPVLRKGIIARFARTLATTLEAGVPIVESIKSVAPMMGSQLYSKAVLHIGDDLVNGHPLSTSMSSTKLFSNMAIQMIAVGEASGKLAEMLGKVADYYEEEVNTVVDNLSSLLEPFIMLILGCIVGGFVIAMYLPIFKIGSLF